MDNGKRVSVAVIKRLPRYFRYLRELLDDGVSRISSKDLSAKMNVTASQIRQDLSNFGCFGQQGYGYNVEFLYKEIGGILGVGQNFKMVIIGAGNLGQALANYSNFEKRGYYVIGIFDNNPDVIDKQTGHLVVRDVKTLPAFVVEHSVDIAVLALPSKNASAAAYAACAAGVKGLWNFCSVDLDAPSGVQVENVHLTDSLMTLSYKICNAEKNPDA